MRPEGLCSELMGVQQTSKSSKNDHKQNRTTYYTRFGFVVAIEVFAYKATSLALWHLDRDPCLSRSNWEVLHRSTWIHLCLCVRKTFFAISPEKWGPFPSIHSSIVVWGMFKTFWRIMNGKIWARRCLHTANIAGRGQACSGFTSDFLQDTFLHRHLAMTQNSRLGQAHLKHYSYPVGGLNILQPFSTPADGTLMKKILWKKIPKHYLQNGKIRAKQMLTTC
jgi:hypothetical protein